MATIETGGGMRGTGLWRGRGAVMSVGLACLVFGVAGASVARAESVGAPTLEQLPEIARWAARNSPATYVATCGVVCERLWSAEEGPMPNPEATQEVYNEFGWFAVGSKLWSPLSELSSQLGARGIGKGLYTLGWLMGGPEKKWMTLEQEGAGAEPELRWCGSLGNYTYKLIEPGEAYGYEGQLSAKQWMYVAGQEYCPFGGIGYYSEATVPGCNPSVTAPPSWAGWSTFEEKTTPCEPEAGVKDFGRDAMRTRLFEFGRPEVHTTQTANWVFETKEPAAPTLAEIETKLVSKLESYEDTTLRKWVEYVVTGAGFNPVAVPSPSEGYGPGSEGASGRPHCSTAKPVNCFSGNESESQTDLSVGGRGVPLAFSRSYNSQAAVAASSPGVFGYGWSSSFSQHLVINAGAGTATVYQANGSTVAFSGNLSVAGTLAAPPWVQATLVLKTDGTYLYTLPDQEVFHFSSAGRLLSVADRNGNTTSLSYTTEGRLEAITAPSGHKITLTYNTEGFVESAKDPMGHTVKYTYEGGELASVTEPGETSARWKFKYDTAHELTEMVDGRGGKTVNEYNGAHRVVAQTDPLGRKTTLEYGESEPFATTITNHATGAVTKEYFDAAGDLISITRAYGTAGEVREQNTYSAAGLVLTHTDGRGDTTTYTYDASGNRTSETTPAGEETKWSYDSTHDVVTSTLPDGETTTITRNAHGEPETISRPAPGSATQTTSYKYDAYGDLTSVEDPLKRVTSYEYADAYGDLTSETDGDGNKRTWEYNEDSQEIASISPRGNVKGAEASKYTSKVERDAQGRPLTVTDPLGHKTKYTYDADGNLETQTDANSHKTKYTYDADNERTKVEEPNKTITETGYDGAGQVISQTDGKKNTTKYVRNALEQVIELIDPKERKTLQEYDPAGNLVSVTDPAKRVTTNTYGPSNRLDDTVYSDGKTHLVQYEYNEDGDVTRMSDGSGVTKYTYDQLDRLTEVENGHKEVIKHEWDLANELTKVTYPNGKAVTRAYDKDGRLEKVTDWLSHATKFAYDPDSDLTASVFPSETKDEDKYTYNEADQLKEVKMSKGSETLASLVYTRDSDGQVKGLTSKKLPGEEKPAFEYDVNSRLSKGAGVAYEYDAANNPTKQGTGSYTYDKADELETGPSVTYEYNEVGQRTKATPTSGPATTYGYDQAGDLTSVERPKEGSSAEINDTYAYNGEGLRTSQTIAGATTYMAWDTSEPLPLLLADGTNSYIYGPGGLPIEQINNSTGTVLYLHHDQAGSTRLLTGSTGTVTGKCTYGPYGTPTCEGTATTPLGFDGQYTSSDTGLIYMRARAYDPATGQFLSRDPAIALTREPYGYAGDNPLTYKDRSGLGIEEVLEGGGSGIPCPWCGATQGISEALEGAYHEVQHGIEWVNNHVGAEELNEPAKQGEAAAQAGCELLEKDGTGKVHGEIPGYPSPDWTEEDLDQVAQDLRDSIERRQQEQAELGEEPGHRGRIGEEERLLRQIEKRLSGS